MKKIGIVFLLCLLTGCATTSTMQISKGQESRLSAIKTVKVSIFQCPDPAVSSVIQNSIAEQLLPMGVRVVNDGPADAVIEGNIAMSNDAVGSAGGYSSGIYQANLYGASGNANSNIYGTASAGAYVSSVTAQIVSNGEVLASANETQARTDMWIPDPAGVMGRKIGKKMAEALKR